jgi:hypothetical protein
MSGKAPSKSRKTVINDIKREIIPSMKMLKASHKEAILAKINKLKQDS